MKSAFSSRCKVRVVDVAVLSGLIMPSPKWLTGPNWTMEKNGNCAEVPFLLASPTEFEPVLPARKGRCAKITGIQETGSRGKIANPLSPHGPQLRHRSECALTHLRRERLLLPKS
jgi:hypothetical protein